MRKLLFCLLTFASISLTAQTDCLKITKDDFTGVITKESNYARLEVGATKVVGFYVTKVDSIYNMKLIYNSDENGYYVAKGREFMLLLNDNQKLVLAANDNYKTKVVNAGTQFQSYSLNATYEVSKYNLELINRVGVKKIRIYYEDKFSDEEINESNNSMISEIIKCLLAN